VQSGQGQYGGRERKMVIMGLHEIRYVKLLKSIKHYRIENMFDSWMTGHKRNAQ
jgi:hypothetical protein